jgi:hypothetical protein
VAFAFPFGEYRLAMTLHPPNIATTTSRLFIKIAIRYQIFEALETGAKSLPELCALTNATPHALRPIVDALIVLQLLATDGQNSYALTDRCCPFLLAEIGAQLHDAGVERVHEAFRVPSQD